MPGVCILDKSCRPCDILATACHTEHLPGCVVQADHEVSCLTRGRLALNQCHLDLTRCLPFILLLLCPWYFYYLVTAGPSVAILVKQTQCGAQILFLSLSRALFLSQLHYSLFVR